MSKTKQQQLDEAYKAYEDIHDTAQEEKKVICDSADEAYITIIRSALESLKAKMDKIEEKHKPIEEKKK